jgi:hypothetical protein
MAASDNSIGAVIGWSCTHLVRDEVTFSMSVMAKHIEDLSQFLQSFGVAPLALLFLPVLITALARNATLALATSLLSFASLMFFVAPASAITGLAIVSGLGSFLVALESILARGRMKEIADLTSRVNELERAEQRRLTLEIKTRGHARAWTDEGGRFDRNGADYNQARQHLAPREQWGEETGEVQQPRARY